MRKDLFPRPSLNLPKSLKNYGNRSEDIFSPVENYINLVGEFVYTDIDLKHEVSKPSHKFAWTLKVVSANVLRSLYLRNAVVDSINSRNVTSLYLSLKAWFEIVGALAAVLDLLKKGTEGEVFSDSLIPYALGNKGKGNLRIGEVEAKSVLTMIEKADKYFLNLSSKFSTDVDNKNFFTDFYDVASNYSHPSFDSGELIGYLSDENLWVAKSPDDYRAEIENRRPEYGGLFMSPIMVQRICTEIFEFCGADLKRISARRYFD